MALHHTSATTSRRLRRRSARSALGRLFVALGLIIGVLSTMVPAQAHTDPSGGNNNFNGTWPPSGSGWQTPAPNPALPAQCGLKVALLMDRSTSIVGHQNNYEVAAKAIVDGLVGSPSSVGVWSFGTNSSANGNSTYPSIDLTPLNSAANINAVKDKIEDVADAIGSGTQYTNYEAGLQAVKKGANAVPDVVIMLTDGAPTVHDGDGTDTSTQNRDVDGGILSANAIKTWTASRTRIIAVGIGSGVSSGSNAEKVLQLISGPTKFNGSNIATADYLLTSFAGGAAALGNLVKSFCQANITVEKRAATPQAPNDYGTGTRANGWQFSATPGATAVTPANQQTGTVDGVPGRVRYTYNVSGSTNIQITETVQPGYSLVGVECTKATPNGSQPVTATLNGSTATIQGVQPTDDITCLFKNQPQFIDLSVTKDDGKTVAEPGDLLTYTISYRNDGNVTATDVVLTETVPTHTTYVGSGWTCVPGVQAGSTCTYDVGSLGAGASGQVEFKVQVADPVPADADQVVNTVTITGTGNELDTDDQTATDTDTIGGTVDLGITKTDGGVSTEPGEVVTYTIGYRNEGDRHATGVVITETVPANTTFNAAASTLGWSCANGSPTGTVCSYALPGTLPPSGTEATITFALNVVSPFPAGVSEIANTATIAGTNENGATLPNEASDTTPVTTSVDLGVTKTDGGVSAEPGDVVAYTIGAYATGDQVVSGATLTETVPAHTTFAAATSTAGWSCADGAAAGTVCTFALADLVPGAAPLQVTFAVTVVDPAPAGAEMLTNTVTITGFETVNEEPNQATDTTPLDAAPVIEVTKDNGLTQVSPGQNLTYVIEVSNTGNQDATSVQVVEVVPANTSFDPDDPANAGWVSLGLGAWGKTVDVPAGDKVQLTFKVTVDNPVAADADEIVNTVTACLGQQCDDDDDTDEIASPDLSVDKTDGVDEAAPGDVLTYSITYRNVGNQDATGVVLTETVPTYTTADPAVVETAQGWVCVDSEPLTADVFEAGSTCTKDLGDVDGGSQGSAQFTVTVDATVPANASSVVNLVGIVDDEQTVDIGEDVDLLDAEPELSVEKENQGNDDVVVPGETVVYEITVTNSGDRDADNVLVIELLPEHTTFVEGAPGNDVWTDLGGGEYSTEIDVAAGASATLTFTVEIDDPVPAGVETIANLVAVCDEPALQPAAIAAEGPQIAQAETCVPGEDEDDLDAAPDLVVTKDDGGEEAQPGDEVTYTITYRNVGNQDATGVVLTETVPTGSTFVGPADWTCVDGTCTYTVGDLAAGAQGSVEFTVQVDADFPSTQAGLHNVVVIADDGENGEDPNPDDNTGTDDTPVTVVLGEVVTPQKPTTEVKGVQLPRTGTDAHQMLLLAGILTIMGGLLLVAETATDQRRRRVAIRKH